MRFKVSANRCRVCGMTRAEHLAESPSPFAWSRPWLAEFACRGWRELFAPLLLALLCGCGGMSTSGNPSDVHGADWKRYDVAPGACLAAFSGGVDWQEFTAQPGGGHGVEQQFLSPGIHVDASPDDATCDDTLLFGLTMRATDEPLSVAIKADAGTVEEYPAGDPSCALMAPQIDSF